MVSPLNLTNLKPNSVMQPPLFTEHHKECLYFSSLTVTHSETELQIVMSLQSHTMHPTLLTRPEALWCQVKTWSHKAAGEGGDLVPRLSEQDMGRFFSKIKACRDSSPDSLPFRALKTQGAPLAHLH